MNKFLEWVESIDPFVLPLTIDVGLSIFLARLITASLEALFDWAA
jgi:hypothetical protein